MKKLLLFVAIAVAAMSCTKTNLDAPENPNGADDLTLSVKVAAQSAADSRVAFEEDGDAYKVTWASTDELGAWGENLFNNDSFNEFKIESGDFDAEESTFTGKINYGSHASAIRFVHPFVAGDNVVYSKENTNNADKYKNAFDANIASQTVETGLTHLSQNAYMMSQTISYDSDDNYATVEQTPIMKHLGATLDITLVAAEGTTFPENCELTSVEISSEKLPTVATINMQEEDVDAAVTAKEFGTITIATPNNCAANGEGFIVPFNIFPFVLAQGDEFTVVAHFEADGKFYTATRKLTAPQEMNFKRAVRNKLEIGCTLEETEAPAETKTVTITGNNFKSGGYTSNDGEGTYQGINLYVNKCYKNSNGIQMNKSYFYNTVALEGLSEIKIDYIKSDNANKLVVYSGTSKDPNNVVNQFNGVYTIPAGHKFFKVYAGGYVVLDYVKITYVAENGGGDGGEVTPDPVTFTGLNPASLTFASGEQDSRDVTIEGSNLDGAEISVEIDDDTRFNVDRSGTKLTVTPNQTNDSDAAYTATVTVTVGSTVKTLDLTQEAKPTTGGDQGGSTNSTVIFDGSELPTSYPNNETITVDGADFTLNLVANFTASGSKDPIQFKKEGSYLYNNNAIEGLTEIVITLAPAGTEYNNFEVYAGTSQNPAGEAIAPAKEGDVCTYALPEGTTFVSIQNNSTHTAYASKIKFAVGDDSGSGDGGTTEPTVTFTGLDKTSVDFASDASGEDYFDLITLQGENLEEATSISVVNSNTVNFTVLYTEGETDFMVYPNAANETGAAYTGTVTVTVDGVERTLAVSQAGSGEPEVTEPVTVKADYYAILDAMGKSESDVSSTAGLHIEGAEFADFSLNSTGLLRLWKTKTGGEIRTYLNNTLIVTAKNGKKITEIKLSGSIISSANVGSGSGNTWTGDASEVVLTTKKGEIDYIQVTVE